MEEDLLEFLQDIIQAGTSIAELQQQLESAGMLHDWGTMGEPLEKKESAWERGLGRFSLMSPVSFGENLSHRK